MQREKPKYEGPQLIPEREKEFYDAIHGLKFKFHKKLKKAWDDLKKKYLSTIEKASPLRSLTQEQRLHFEDLHTDFRIIAEEALTQGVSLGTDFFETQFKIAGLSKNQQKRITAEYLDIFGDKAGQLFINDAVTQLKEADTFQKQEKLLSGFDRFLFGYANIAVAAAYNIFMGNITGLNNLLNDKYKISDLIFPKDPVKVLWVLRETAQHSVQCITLSLGEDGSGNGIWDARILAENQLFPASPRLDCGGNCRCHLSPIAPEPEGGPTFLRDLLRVGPQKNSLEVVPNMTKKGLKDYFVENKAVMPIAVLEDITDQEPFRRREFYTKLPSFEARGGKLSKGILFDVVKGDQFLVSGQTMITPQGATSVYVKIVLGPQDDINKLTLDQRHRIRTVFAHELGHLVTAVDAKGNIVSNFLSKGEALELLEIANRERAKAIVQIQNDFERVLRKIPKSELSRPEVKRDIAILRSFFEKPDDFIEELFKARQKGTSFAGMDPNRAYQLFRDMISKHTASNILITSYQLKDAEEFFADWFARLLTDPSKAALYSPSLNKAIANKMDNFFETAVTRRVRTALPEATSILFRTDIPVSSGFQPVAPSLRTYKSATDKFTTQADTLSSTALRRQLTDLIKANPNLQRDEFYKNLDVTFVSRTSMGVRIGSRSAIGFYEDGKFFVNADAWKNLSMQQRQTTVADIISQNMWRENLVQNQTAKAYTDYLAKTLRDLTFKVGQQELDGQPIKELIGTIVGPPRNISVWMRNFNDFRPFISKVSDLPIIDVDSLASPQAFFRSWFRLYMVNPGAARYYNHSLTETVNDFLVLSKKGR
jgi:hypothetical protein